MTFKYSVNAKKFKIYIENLRQKWFMDDICIFFDNLGAHRSHEVSDRLNELSIPCIFSPPYSPDFNGIESLFSIYKNKLKRRRLNAIVHGKTINLEEETMRIFDEIDREKIINCIDFSLTKLFNFKFK